MLDSFSQEAFFVAMFSKEQADRFLFLVFRHVEPGDTVLPKEVMAEGQRQFCFPDPRWTKEEKRTFRAAGMGKSQFSPP
jgi:hypothetical protein